MAGKQRPIISSTGNLASGSPAPRAIESALDRLIAVQRPLVLANLRAIRRANPNAGPNEIIRSLERRYLTAITAGGAAVGVTGVIPGVGTAVSLALSGAETAGFLEATAMFGQSLSEIHGIAVEEPERARALILTLMLGREGTSLVRQLAGQATGSRGGRSSYWGELVTSALPMTVIGPLVDRLRAAFLRRFAVEASTSMIGRVLPFGIGAVVGGVGNNVLGRRVIDNARLAFGEPPHELPASFAVSAKSARGTRSVGPSQRVTRALQSFGAATWDAASDASRTVGTASTSATRSVGRSVTTAGRSVVHVSSIAGQRAADTSTHAWDAVERASHAATKRAEDASSSAREMIERLRIERERPDGLAPGEVDIDEDGSESPSER